MNTTNLKNIFLATCKKVAPVWPIKNTVAVNPFLGLSDKSFYHTTRLLAERSGINTTMPLEFYITQIEKNEILAEDLNAALIKNDKPYHTPASFITTIRRLQEEPNNESAFQTKTITDIVSEVTGKNWNAFLMDKISAWAAAYFDENQAFEKAASPTTNLYEAWKFEAEIDQSSDLMGLKKFRSTLKKLSADDFDSSAFILHKLGIPEIVLESYLHTLLLKTLGWSSYIAGIDWQNNLYRENTSQLCSFLSILLACEYCLLESTRTSTVESRWLEHINTLVQQEEIGTIDEKLEARVICQDAYDFSCERQLRTKFDESSTKKEKSTTLQAQAVFCIDVRSEIYRRNLENANRGITTIGFAGFFGFPINYIPLTHEEGKNQCPVLIPSGPVVRETFDHKEAAIQERTAKNQTAKTWKKYAAGAISSFGFVSTMGLFYLPKLIGSSYRLLSPVEDPSVNGLAKHIQKGRKLDLSEIPLKEKINMAASALTAMGLKDKMAPLVLIVGHGSSSVNNPHASGLDCGACGGHSGEINAFTAATILNSKEIRTGLLFEKEIQIPEDTYFIAGKHDTTTDEITLIGTSEIPKNKLPELEALQSALTEASNATRIERARRFGLSELEAEEKIRIKSKDWSQVRPEWGLAGNNAFVIAPRHRTSGINLEGKSFLHSYDWKTDEGFKILETIMTAPMVVTSWINLQYYASTTDNERLGSGNKTLHNVTGGIGVIEGAGGDLRIGLPFQSIHDGKNYQHLPQRLNVVIEAPIEAVTTILKKHPSVKNLVENSWIKLLILDEDGKISKRYNGNYNWIETKTKNSELKTLINF